MNFRIGNIGVEFNQRDPADHPMQEFYIILTHGDSTVYIEESELRSLMRRFERFKKAFDPCT